MEFDQTKSIGLLKNINWRYVSLKVCGKAKKRTQKLENDGNFRIRQAETPKDKRHSFGSRFGHFHPW